MMLNSRTIAIVGQGYVGLPLSIAATKAGWHVIGIEKSSEIISKISNGISPFRDLAGLKIELLLSSNLYEISNDFSKVSNARTIIFCVPTPITANGNPDLSLLELAIRQATPYFKDQTLIINESTSYPGTLRNFIVPLVLSSKGKSTNELYFAVAPERINPGDPVWNIVNTPRIISGINNKDIQMAFNFYKSFTNEVIQVSSPEVAEASKLLENAFRLINISFINELTRVCDGHGIDINEVIDAAKTKPYGFMEFRPSLGVGGHCIPVDPQYLQFWARQSGLELESITHAVRLNKIMPNYVAKKAKKIAKGDSNTVLILGVAYKSGTADTRETPVKGLRLELEKLGYKTVWYDELVSEWESGKITELDTNYCVAIVTINQPNTEKNIQFLMENQVPILYCASRVKT